MEGQRFQLDGVDEVVDKVKFSLTTLRTRSISVRKDRLAGWLVRYISTGERESSPEVGISIRRLIVLKVFKLAQQLVERLSQLDFLVLVRHVGKKVREQILSGTGSQPSLRMPKRKRYRYTRCSSNFVESNHEKNRRVFPNGPHC